MNYNYVFNRIKEYLELEDFDLDEKYISVKKLRELINNKIYGPFNTFYLENELNSSINYINTVLKEHYKKKEKIFKNSEISDVSIAIDENTTTLTFFTKIGNIEIKKNRNDEAYISNYEILNDEELSVFNEKNNSSKIIKKIEELENIYDLLKIKGTVIDLKDMNIILNDEGVYYCYNDKFFEVKLSLFEDYKIKIDFENDEQYIKKYTNYLGKGRIIDILNDAIPLLENKIKIKITNLPELLQILVNDELEKLKEKKDIKILEKK